ncbi:SMC family ATPase [Paenibacillus campi]|uniref:SMC family ATPase n=1 Tax=Paenibacillus campi TaxID=3106031 RepID=UPI002AFEB71F|nr:SMC family ATPase [Paenibacillus sp. SGZ-1009]
MKPITLKLSGLQSYREQQEIDFTELCETGLFGIFGPTGSGKSTVLDAITLALYGKVERAQNGTQGILNHSEDAVFVSFSFELLSDAGAQVYRVERRFKRTGDHTVSNSMSRFIVCNPGSDEVIADKLGDVTRCVEEYIGLKMDDFTRAVVLPQGKFAEFLSLKGSDRRQMLQRLFHLERYGDRLMQKLNQRVKDTDHQLERFASEQTGLGDASADAVKQAKEHLTAMTQEAERVRARLLDMNGQVEQLGKVRELLRERELLHTRQERLRQHEPDIRLLEQELADAESALTLLPLLDAWKEVQTQSAAAEQQLNELQFKLQQVEQSHEQAAAGEQKARLELATHEPRLLLRLEQLGQALELQQQCAELEQAQRMLHERLQQLEAEIVQVQQQAESEQRMLHKAEQRRAELEQQLKECEVRSSDRRELQEAQQRLGTLDSLRARQAELEQEHKEYAATSEQHNTQWQRLEQQSAKLALTEQHLYGMAVAAQTVQQEQERLLTGAHERLEQLEQQCQQASRQAESHRLAARLAAELQDGQPCVVCGSLHHPQPAAAAVADVADTADLHHDLQMLHPFRQLAMQYGERMRNYGYELERIIADWEWQHAQAEVAVSTSGAETSSVNTGDYQYSDHDKEASLSPFILSETEHEQSSLHASLLAAEAWFARYGTAVQALERQMDELRQQLRLWRQEQREWTQRYTAVQAERQSVQRLYEQSALRLEAGHKAVQESLDDWQHAHGELSQQEARQRFTELTKRDEQAEQIRAGLEKSVPYMEERKHKLQQYEQQTNALERQQIELRTRFEAEERQLQEKRSRLEQWIGGQSAEELLQQSQSELERYRSQATHWARQLRTAQEQQQQAAQACALATQSAQALATQVAQAQTRWQQALAASRFTDEQHVNTARMDEQQQVQGRQRIEQHREQQSELTVRLRELESRLDGQHVSEQEWQGLQQNWQQARQADEAALEQRARATRDVEDLEHRHIRWLELERQREQLAIEASYLSKLQSSMRGNAFVEYIAEEQLMQVSLAASERLRFLTRQRYSLEVDSGGGFVICDNGNGGIRRPVSTLSGGETFLTSLSLALALSAQIQLRGKYPLQFFFLDEGFGTLDPELLDTVVTSLEKLHTDRLAVGIISHVPELRMRLPRKLVIIPAEQAGKGSKVVLEKM